MYVMAQLCASPKSEPQNVRRWPIHKNRTFKDFPLYGIIICGPKDDITTSNDSVLIYKINGRSIIETE